MEHNPFFPVTCTCTYSRCGEFELNSACACQYVPLCKLGSEKENHEVANNVDPRYSYCCCKKECKPLADNDLQYVDHLQQQYVVDLVSAAMRCCAGSRNQWYRSKTWKRFFFF